MNNPQNFNGFSQSVTHKMRDIGEKPKEGSKKGAWFVICTCELAP